MGGQLERLLAGGSPANDQQPSVIPNYHPQTNASQPLANNSARRQSFSLGRSLFGFVQFLGQPQLHQ